MRQLTKCAALAFAIVLSIGSASAETNLAQGVAQAMLQLDANTAAALNDALAKGDAQAVELVVASKSGDVAATQAIAAIVLAAAQSLKATDPSGAGILAAIAITSGGLQGNDAVTAANLVNVSGSAIAAAVVAFSQASVPPAVIAASVLIGVTVNPVQLAQNGGQVTNSCVSASC